MPLVRRTVEQETLCLHAMFSVLDRRHTAQQLDTLYRGQPSGSVAVEVG
jgi:hypothetical protein